MSKHRGEAPALRAHNTPPIVREDSHAECIGLTVLQVCPKCLPIDYPQFARHRAPRFRGAQCQEIERGENGAIRCPLSIHKHLDGVAQIARNIGNK